MKIKKRLKILKIVAAFAFSAMVFVNYLANALPINGVTTGEASDAYANLFTPAAVTFSIWGLIYLLLAAFILYLFGLFRKNKPNEQLLIRLLPLFIITCLANSFWIFSWHYDLIALSLFFMIGLLIALIKIAQLFNNRKLSNSENKFIRLPFSIYFGWITVATIANITVFLVKMGWNGFNLSDQLWTIIILLVGAVIAITRGLKDKNIPYLLVLVWAYLGIWLKHTSEQGYNGQYPGVIRTTLFSIFVFISTIVFIARKEKPLQLFFKSE
jgi:hypothetical protein